MSDSTIVILVSVALAVVALLYMVIGFSSRRSARFLVVGIGMLLLIVGLALMGWMQLLINGVRSLVDWFMRTALTQQITWGAGLAIVGLLACLLGRLIPVKSRSEVRMARADRELREMEKQRSARRRERTESAPASPVKPAPAARPASSDPEITQIMNKHGL